MSQRNRLVVLDIDSTLLHTYSPDSVCSTSYQYFVNLARKDAYLQTNNFINYSERRFYHISNHTLDVVIVLRKGLRSFLQQLMRKYDVAIWSAGSESYVKTVEGLLYLHGNEEKSPFIFSWNIKHTKRRICPHNTALLGYSKPLDFICSQYSQYPLNNIVLFDDRTENAVNYLNHLVQVPPYDDEYFLSGNAVQAIDNRFHALSIVDLKCQGDKNAKSNSSSSNLGDSVFSATVSPTQLKVFPIHQFSIPALIIRTLEGRARSSILIRKRKHESKTQENGKKLQCREENTKRVLTRRSLS
jgi:hypothetical protein